jgi:hypothetical protein
MLILSIFGLGLSTCGVIDVFVVGKDWVVLGLILFVLAYGAFKMVGSLHRVVTAPTGDEDKSGDAA